MYKLLLALSIFSVNIVEASEQLIPMVKHDAQTFYVNVKIADQLTEEFVIDTGASHVTISDTIIKKLLDNHQATFVRLMTGVLADGSTIEVPVYRVSRLKIGANCEFKDVEVAVIKGGARCVLGLSALRYAAPFTFHVDPPQIQLSNCSAA